ncbi:hydroxylysine kinase [Stomoxys calcitrans]|uniref:hydroxylysine kinase n=1 Tax=Stomoxys calcitrans TaxID=35570 RepID=UPI0027E2FE63|nr:hydroxylysine kinase [Stomoxys calcitrans]XP_013111964.2 hydroxylysine kinase [Stomoxys calcitrans]XP_013111965.2 hydroxylysine kinase [Stomoxys calcitrans]
MDDAWNNVELTNISRRKSYTLNHNYDATPKTTCNNNEEQETPKVATLPETKTDSEACLQPGSDIKPKVTNEDVESLLRRLYGISLGEIKPMLSYDDRNYLVTEDPNIKNPLIVSHSPHGYVLKILNSLDSKKEDVVDAQNQLMLYLSKQVKCPRPVANVNGKYYSVETLSGVDHIVRLLEYIPGKMLHEVPITNYLLYNCGEYLAQIVKNLKNFEHAAYNSHKSTWQLQSVPNLKEFVYVLSDVSRRALVEEIIETFQQKVLSQLGSYEMQIIHGDFNEQNIVVERFGANEQDYRVKGIIDFGDTNKSPILFEIGIALTYMVLQAKNLESGGIFLAGFETVCPLNAHLKQNLKYCVAARLAQSLVMGAYTHSLDPSNEYVLVTQEQGWKLIEELWHNTLDTIDDIWEAAADHYLKSSVK